MGQSLCSSEPDEIDPADLVDRALTSKGRQQNTQLELVCRLIRELVSTKAARNRAVAVIGRDHAHVQSVRETIWRCRDELSDAGILSETAGGGVNTCAGLCMQQHGAAGSSVQIRFFLSSEIDHREEGTSLLDLVVVAVYCDDSFYSDHALVRRFDINP